MINRDDLMEKYNNLTEAEKDFFYRQKHLEYVIEDVRSHCEDHGYELTEEQIQEAAESYVDGEYDCNLSYWDNIDNLVYDY